MHGISISRKTKRDYTDFVNNFSCIFEKIDELYWYIPSLIFTLPEKWNYGKYIPEEDIYNNKEWKHFMGFFIKHDEDRTFKNMIVKPGFLNQFSKYFVDDWCDIYGFSFDCLEMILNKKEIDDKFIKSLFKKSLIQVYFRNVDAAYWDFFTTDDKLFNYLYNTLKNDNNFELRKPYLKLY